MSTPVGGDRELDLDGAAARRAVLDRVGQGLGRGEQDAAGAVGGPLLAGQDAGEGGAHERDDREVGRDSQTRVDAVGHGGYRAGRRVRGVMETLSAVYDGTRPSRYPRRSRIRGALPPGRRLDSGAATPTGGSRVPEHRPSPPIAGYLAQPHEVHRVVLLYSGGLDTSVMLKWIQDEYDAEVVALCIDLGQPADDFDAVRQKALDLGAVESLVVDAKEEFARDYVAPAIRANARYQGGYPLFTSLGRPAAGQAGVRRGPHPLGRHHRPRLHRQGQRPGPHRGDDRDARARPEGDRAGARVADGPRRGDRLRDRARHPDLVDRRAPVLDRRQPLGPLQRGRGHRGPRPAAAGRRLPAGDAPDQGPRPRGGPGHRVPRRPARQPRRRGARRWSS